MASLGLVQDVAQSAIALTRIHGRGLADFAGHGRVIRVAADAATLAAQFATVGFASDLMRRDPALRAAWCCLAGGCAFALTLTLLAIHYDTAAISTEAVAALAERLRAPDDTCALTQDCNRTALARGRSICVHHAFEAQIRRTPDASIDKLYGPTETTIWSSTWPVAEVNVSIGTPYCKYPILCAERWSSRAYGRRRELWIGGEGVVRGYWQQPLKNASVPTRSIRAACIAPAIWCGGGRTA